MNDLVLEQQGTMHLIKEHEPHLGDPFQQMTGSESVATVERLTYAFSDEKAQYKASMDEDFKEYNGGSWSTVEVLDADRKPTGLAYRRLNGKVRAQVRNPGAFCTVNVSPDAAGIITTLYALNTACWHYYHQGMNARSQRLGDKFHQLRTWAFDNHPEAREIAQALD